MPSSEWERTSPHRGMLFVWLCSATGNACTLSQPLFAGRQIILGFALVPAVKGGGGGLQGNGLVL